MTRWEAVIALVPYWAGLVAVVTAAAWWADRGETR